MEAIYILLWGFCTYYGVGRDRYIDEEDWIEVVVRGFILGLSLWAAKQYILYDFK